MGETIFNWLQNNIIFLQILPDVRLLSKHKKLSNTVCRLIASDKWKPPKLSSQASL